MHGLDSEIKIDNNITMFSVFAFQHMLLFGVKIDLCIMKPSVAEIHSGYSDCL